VAWTSVAAAPFRSATASVPLTHRFLGNCADSHRATRGCPIDPRGSPASTCAIAVCWWANWPRS
jgi:hypothetical protein